MKLKGRVPNTPHAKEIYNVDITRYEIETLDLILAMYAPFISNTKILLLNGETMKQRLKRLRMGINQIKREINNGK